MVFGYDLVPDDLPAYLAFVMWAIVLEAELKAAERALAEEMTEENYARFRAIQEQLERSDAADGLG